MQIHPAIFYEQERLIRILIRVCVINNIHLKRWDVIIIEQLHLIKQVTQVLMYVRISTGENLDAVTAVTDSFKMTDAFADDRTGGAVPQTNPQTVAISVS